MEAQFSFIRLRGPENCSGETKSCSGRILQSLKLNAKNKREDRKRIRNLEN